MSVPKQAPELSDPNPQYPFEPAARGAWAEQRFAEQQSKHALGTRERAGFLLDTIQAGFPTPLLTEAYFANLSALLGDRAPLPERGKLVLGLSSGRSGSTSLTALLRTIPGVLATHENPPHVFWQPLEAQLDFHRRRFDVLTRYAPLVVDISHWWLPALEAMREAFPTLRHIALVRDSLDCAHSFLRLKGYGAVGLNHWAEPLNGYWPSALWDPTYPSYPVSESAVTQPDLKTEMVLRYVREYNDRLRGCAAAEPERWLIVQTERLSSAETQRRIFAFLGREGRFVDPRLNVRSTYDSEFKPLWF